MLIKKFFWVAVGAAGALQVDKWLSERRARFTPNAMTGALLDKVNRRLETKRGIAPEPTEPGL
jgi:hypothetical protein